MSWTIADVDQHNKGLNDKQKETWIQVANDALKRCETDGGKNCDASAIKQANAVIAKNMTFETWQKEYIAGQTYNLNGIEIFAEGKWNGDNYTIADLDAMVSAFDGVGFEPPLKLGHNAAQEKQIMADGQPALGWVGRIYREGATLLADFKNVPQQLYDAIKRGNYKNISAEIYWNYTSNGKQWPRVLRAVALLGADIPAVTGLASITGLYADGHNEYKIYNVKEEVNMDEVVVKELTDKLAALEAQHSVTMAQMTALKDENKNVVAKLTEQSVKAKRAEVREFIRVCKADGRLIPAVEADVEALLMGASETQICDYAADTCPNCKGTGKLADGTKCPDCANKTNLSQRQLIERLFTKLPVVMDFSERGRENGTETFTGGYSDAGTEVDNRAKHLMSAGKAKTYGEAVKAVLASDAELKKNYTGGI